jgi:hypothetical protein
MVDIKIPDLIDLPVYRDAYLSQERTDALCSRIWEERPDLVERFVQNARRFDFPLDRDAYFTKPNAAVISYLREKEKAGEVEPISITAMVDFMYELDHRIRKIVGKPKIEIIGDPIAQGPDGPFLPELVTMPIYRDKEGKPQKGMTQEIADRLCPQIYAHFLENNPEVIFAYRELDRRQFRSGEPSWVVFSFVRDFVKSLDEEVDFLDLKTEFRRRLACITYRESTES